MKSYDIIRQQILFFRREHKARSEELRLLISPPHLKLLCMDLSKLTTSYMAHQVLEERMFEGVKVVEADIPQPVVALLFTKPLVYH